jgi:glycosyltransferase involved in cell wall biosynthesis
MFNNKQIQVIVPAYNEERLIGKVIETMPDFVDKIIIINDCSKDRTKEIVQDFMNRDGRIFLLTHEVNKGLGESLIDGYLKALELGADVVAVMAGDAQMDPKDLIKVIEPVVEEKADYVKGNRLLHDNVSNIMPKYRFLGNSFLTLWTKFATGYWHLIDPQCGYTAIARNALKEIPIKEMVGGYGYNADILNMLNLYNFRVKDVEVRPVYGEEKSKIKLSSYIPRVSWLLNKLFWRRMWRKYLVREFHPLVFFYFLSFFNIFLIAPLCIIRIIWVYYTFDLTSQTTLIIFVFTLTMSVFSFFFGMWLDMEDNKRLKV